MSFIGPSILLGRSATTGATAQSSTGQNGNENGIAEKLVDCLIQRLLHEFR
jgi:hypothetical protein